MANKREIYIVNATQVVTSENHPEGMFSVMTGFPKTFDSESYNGSTDDALRAAKAEYFNRLSLNYAANNRAMTTLTLEMSNGKQIMRDSEGGFPTVTPAEPEEPESPEEPEEPIEPEGT